MAVDPVAPFLWGSGGRRLTPEEIAAERKGAAALGQQAMSTAPVGHWSQGLNRVLQGLMAGYDDSRASDAAKQNSTESAALVQALLGGGAAASPAPAVAPAMPTSVPAPSSGGVSTPMGNTSIPVSGDDNAARAMAFFQSKGMAPADAAALVWNFQQESGKNLNPTLSHDGGTGFGIAGFRDPTPGQGRWTNLRNFAAENKLNPNSLDAQLQFAWNELQGPENATFQKIQAARTPEEKAAAAIGYFRPRADYAAARAARAGEVNSLLRGQSVQVASNDPTFAPAAPQILDANQPSPLDTAQYPAGPVGAPVAVADGSDPAALPTNAQPAQGALPTAQAVQAATQPARPAINPAILQAMTSPYVNDQTRQIATLLFKSQMDQQAKASDPMRQLQMQKLQADIDKARGKAGTTEYGLNPIYGTDENGNPVLGTMGKDGTFKKVDTSGVKISTGVDKIDLGTQFAIYDKKSGQLIGYQPKDIAGAAKAKEVGAAEGKAAVAAPGDIQAGQNALDIIGKIRAHPYLDRGTGVTSLANALPGSGGYDFQNMVDQAKSGAFLSAIQQMRGLGSLSNAEGGAATAAVNRMNTATSKEAFLDALNDYEKIVKQGMARAQSKLGSGADAVPPVQDGWQDVGGVKIRRKQ